MKDILGYEGQYAITSCGKVWSYYTNKFLLPQKNNKGYCYVHLCKDGKVKNYLIHRLVAEAYIPNQNNLSDVNHLDENPLHNYINNLEWTTHKENMNYGTRNKRISKPVYCVELDKVFDSGAQAAKELGLSAGNISSCCNGRIKSVNGYHFNFF